MRIFTSLRNVLMASAFMVLPTIANGAAIFENTLLGDEAGFTIQNTVAIPEGLSYVWQNTSNYGWKATGYLNGNFATESWLVSPVLNLTSATAPIASFEQALNFLKGAKRADFVNVYVSTNYTNDVTTAQWTALTIPTWPSSDSWTFVPTGDIDLKAYAGKSIRMGFKYASSAATACTWEFKNFSVTDNGGAPVDPNPGSTVGTKENPLTVAQVIAHATDTTCWIKGFIVGNAPTGSLSKISYSTDSTLSASNLILAMSDTVRTIDRCIPIQLSSGTATRNRLNLVENPECLGKEVLLKGTITKYFGVRGLKSVTDFAFVGAEPEKPLTTSTIASLVEAATAGKAKVEATVMAVYGRGFLLNDGTGSILAYLGTSFDTAFYPVGSQVTVEGTTSLYGGMLQFTSDANITKTGTTTVSYPAPAELTGTAFDALANEKEPKYIRVTGTLTQTVSTSGTYYNFTVPGAEALTGSISYPIDSSINDLDGKEVVVTGYFIGTSGSSTKYGNIMATQVASATGIDHTTLEAASVEYFDLTGKQVLNPTRGLYIQKCGEKISKVIFN